MKSRAAAAAFDWRDVTKIRERDDLARRVHRYIIYALSFSGIRGSGHGIHILYRGSKLLESDRDRATGYLARTFPCCFRPDDAGESVQDS